MYVYYNFRKKKLIAGKLYVLLLNRTFKNDAKVKINQSLKYLMRRRQ